MTSRTILRTQSFLLHNLADILFITVIGLSLGFQGWNSRTINFDHINFIWGAGRFLKDGISPDRGDALSYRVYATPGTGGPLLSADTRFLIWIKS